MCIFAQDVSVVSAAVSVGGTEGDIIHMESAESPEDGASDCVVTETMSGAAWCRRSDSVTASTRRL